MNELDVRVFRFLHDTFSGGWTWPMVVLSALGGGWATLAVFPLLASPRTRRLGGSLAGVLCCTAALVFVLKRVVGRVRPCAVLPDVQATFYAAPTDCSFPSGHAAGSFTFAVFLAFLLVKAAPRCSPRERLLRRAGAGGLVLIAIAIGCSRVALGVHYPGDVLAGAILGATVGTIGAQLHLRGRVVIS